MNILINKRFYKGISLFIKLTFLSFSFYYIFQKLDRGSLESLKQLHFHIPSFAYCIPVFLLMLINWALEAKKWQLLISDHESISFIKSFQSVLAGVSISLFTPNRIGEFAGRIFFLESANKYIASIRSLTGSMIQLLITVIAGTIGIIFYQQMGYNQLFSLSNLVEIKNKWLFLILILALLAGVWLINKFFLKTKAKVYFDDLRMIKKEKWVSIFWLSSLRYFVFTTQFFLLLQLFNIECSLLQAFVLISIVFLINSAIPSFAFTEIVTRSAASIYVFSILPSAQPMIISAASTILWIINLAIPAIIGNIFICKIHSLKKITSSA